ncbi:MAG: hypothetical protein JWO82_4275 [Akkermansiaceae bacterium]|nr:hypothetical protein [Akkermansiaceae bacterium]
MKFKVPLPVILSALAAAVAGSLFLSTAARRQRTAEAFRAVAAATASGTKPTYAQRTAGAALLLSRPLPAGMGRESAVRERMQAALAIMNRVDRTRALLALMRDFTTADFCAALDSYPVSMAGRRDEFFMTLFDELGKRDPDAALDYAAHAPGMEEVAGKLLFESGVDSVMEWTKADPSGKRLRAVVDRLMKENPAFALEALGALPVEQWRKPLALLIQNNDGNSREDVQKWFDGLTDPVQRRAAETTILQFLGKDALEPGGLARREPPPRFSFDYIGQWIVEEPAGAREAVAQLPAGPQRRRSVEIIMTDALQHSDNPAEVMAQFAGDLDGKLRAAAVEGLAYRDGALALERSGTLIEDPTEREIADVRTLAIWAENHEPEARKWMDDHQVSDNVRTRANEEIERRKKSARDEFLESEQAKATGR